MDFNPALVAVALQTDAFDGFEDFGIRSLLGCRCAAAQVAGADGTAARRYLIQIALIGVGQIRRYFQIDDFARLGLVIQLGQVFLVARTGSHADQGDCYDDRFHIGHIGFLWDVMG